MDARDVAALRAAGIRGDGFGGLDFDAVDRSFCVGRGARAAVSKIVRSGFSAVLQGEQSGFGFARGLERFACDGIDVIAASNEGHGASGVKQWRVISG